jgi:FkbM family methyltransferase
MKTYSHPATRQDAWLMEVFPYKAGGTALEIGGYDGLTHSNTLALEETGWDCTLIEAVPEFYEQMVANRPKAKCINAAVSGSEVAGLVEQFYVNGQYSGIISSMSCACADEHWRRDSPTIELICKRLPDLVSTRHFDYISLDTEGSEEYILKDWFGYGGTCDALTVEFNYDGEKFDILKHLCDVNGMDLDRVQGFDMFFLRRADV